MMRRVEDWPARLADFVEARRGRPFAWGEQDCVSLAADAVWEITGVDLLAPHRGAYATEGQAEAIVAAAGGMAALLADLAGRIGLSDRPVRRAQRGDLVLVQVGNQQMAGVVNGTTVVVPGAEHIQFVPLRCIQRAWAV